MSNKYVMSSSPHISTSKTTRSIMLDVIIALMPATIAGSLIFGLYSLLVVAVSIISAVCAEALFNKITKRDSTLGDLSAIVTGLILGLNLPPTVSLHIPVIGAFFAIIVVKMILGGLGKNFANPAMTARIFLVLAFTAQMTVFVTPIDLSKGASALVEYFPLMFKHENYGAIEAFAQATPLANIKQGILPGVVSPDGVQYSLLSLFLGTHGGTIGETSALALLIGGVYLLIRRVIDWKIPVIYLATSSLMILALYDSNYNLILPGLMSGGLLIGSIYMATDYSSSPNYKWAVVIYAVGLGVLTEIFRKFSSMNEGVSFAILLMNVVTPLLDKYIYPRSFGYIKEKKVKLKKEKVENQNKQGAIK